MSETATPIIVKTPDVCFGRARIRDTRIPVWILVRYRKSGATDEQLIEYYPHLTVTQLQAAWDDYEHQRQRDRAGDLVQRHGRQRARRGPAAGLGHHFRSATGHSRGRGPRLLRSASRAPSH